MKLNEFKVGDKVCGEIGSDAGWFEILFMNKDVCFGLWVDGIAKHYASWMSGWKRYSESKPTRKVWLWANDEGYISSTLMSKPAVTSSYNIKLPWSETELL